MKRNSGAFYLITLSNLETPYLLQYSNCWLDWLKPFYFIDISANPFACEYFALSFFSSHT